MRTKGFTSVVLVFLVFIIITLFAVGIALFTTGLRNLPQTSSKIIDNTLVNAVLPYPNSAPNGENTTQDNSKSKLLENGWYVIKDTGVYCKSYGEELFVNDADPATFKFVDPGSSLLRGFFKDKNYVYNAFSYPCNHKIDNSDATSFKFLNDHFSKDKNQAYYDVGTVGAGYSLTVLNTVDAGTFDSVSNFIAKDTAKVYFVKWSGLTEIKGADPKTITAFSNKDIYYSKDKRNVYFAYSVVPNADINTFKYIEDTFQGAVYAKDDKYVFYCDPNSENLMCKLIAGADSATFGLISDGDLSYANGYIAKDKTKIYSRGIPLTNSDSATFRITGHSTAQDKNNSYSMGCQMDGCRLEVVSGN